MDDLIALVDRLRSRLDTPNGKFPLRHLGLISCNNIIRIKHVPFYEHHVVVILSGRKVMFDADVPLFFAAGSAITVPAPGSFNLCNEPDANGSPYCAIGIPFKNSHLERLRKVHDIDHIGQPNDIGVLNFRCDETLTASVKQYLEVPNESRMLEHRLMEILLVLVEKDARLLSYALNQENWSQKVRSILSADLAREWGLADVCRHLATSESTLRRNLQREETGFRELLYELRLSSALSQLLQTSTPIYQIAYDCGYQSVSRFSSNFRKRFGLPPTKFRASMDEKEQILAAIEHPAML